MERSADSLRIKNWTWYISIWGIALLYALMLAAPFIAPYSHKQQFREHFYMPPTEVHFFDLEGTFSLRPFIYDYKKAELAGTYKASQQKLFVNFLVEGSPYRWLGLSFRTHLFGLNDESKQIFLLGSDALGRDLFSRILFGAQFSLSVGVLAIFFASLFGVIFGCWAGYWSGWADRVIMRICDLLLSLPALFLVLGLRAVFPLQMSGRDSFWMIVLIFTVIGWSTITRIIRGQVLTLRNRQYVLAAQAAGASPWRVLLRHILPFTTNYLVVQCAVFVPMFIMGEITLSFLGVGVQEPDVSWGNLLAAGNSIQAMSQYPWLLSPALFILLTAFLFNLAGDELRVIGKQRARWW
jgi:peptide/nickel transport system permease protein